MNKHGRDNDAVSTVRLRHNYTLLPVCQDGVSSKILSGVYVAQEIRHHIFVVMSRI